MKVWCVQIRDVVRNEHKRIDGVSFMYDKLILGSVCLRTGTLRVFLGTLYITRYGHIYVAYLIYICRVPVKTSRKQPPKVLGIFYLIS